MSINKDERGSIHIIARADPGRNLTRAQQKDRGRGYMGVAIPQNLSKKGSVGSTFIIDLKLDILDFSKEAIKYVIHFVLLNL